MATYRTIRMDFWNDPYVEGMEPQDKLLYVYLFSSPHTNNLGVLTVSRRKIAFETGLTEEGVAAGLAALQRDFPDVDVQAEISRIRDWQAEKCTPIRNVWRFLRAWLSNAKAGKPRVPRREAPVSVAASQFRAEPFPPSPEALAENCDRGLAWCRRILNREVAA